MQLPVVIVDLELCGKAKRALSTGVGQPLPYTGKGLPLRLDLRRVVRENGDSVTVVEQRRPLPAES